MVKIVNVKKYEDALKEYLTGGDFAHPFIIAGWSGIGKTEIANKLKAQYPNLEIKDYYLESDSNDVLNQLKQDWSSNSESPQLICITTGVDMQNVRKIANLGCDVHFLEFDIDLWKEWAREKNETTGTQNVDELFLSFVSQHPESLHTNIREQKNIQEKLEQKINEFCSYNGTDGDALLDILKFIYIGQQILYIQRKDVDPQWEKIMNYLTENRTKFSIEDQAKIQQAIMFIGTQLNQLFF